jgi:hypothetical protein
MIVTNAQVAMTARQEYREEHQITKKLDFWLTEKPVEAKSETTPRWGEEVSISPRGFSLLELQRNQTKLDLTSSMDTRARLNLVILQALYEAITGRKMIFADPLKLNDGTLSLDGAATAPTPQPAAEQSAGYGLIYQHHERYQEQEKMQFNATGVIRTEDGREIAFSTSLSMSRSYTEESNLIIRAGDAKKIDPLVINFDGKGAQLSQTRFKFDLDNNGTEEQIASLRPGSGYLALDRNGDGIINNGSELFGPTSGLGFAELARFDEDGNHFIDEGDSIYHQLRIWSFNEDGSQQLVALGDKNIGAVFLGHVTSPFQLKDENNKSLGEISNSGFFLYENGTTGLVQEINLTV